MHINIENQDCVLGMKSLPGESVDVVITSPPYNIGIAYNSYDDKGTREDYLNWTRDWTHGVNRVLKDDGSFFINIGASPKDPLLPHQIALQLSEDFVLQNTFHWIKAVSVETREGDTVSAGHFKPINSKRYVTDCHEYVFHFTKHGNVPLDRLAIGVPYADKSNIARWGHTDGKDKRCRGNTWFVPYETIKSRSKDRPHPATFPAKLAEHCIRIHGEPEQSCVMDPFLGIGHSLRAAQACKASQFIGFEIDPDYFKEAQTLTHSQHAST
ncbi:site-specific DNA-methyltransferase [Rubellicoccus peritrichatus]|uniref:Methyltransferase n=1 Tax=Rubellicoccus peritrichatus TaxID=3080537 RepID=A0AAQ3L7B8_9BACT|nr:site-specific DNA-methyltransferase [Puniceicoccus sp. CR14]WOO39292.1 site-specific DNA-methyltransferase [Puniceicoccus sp. CR14]